MIMIHTPTYRICQAKQEGARVVDIDGSFLSIKHARLSSAGMICAPLPLPHEPPLGWTNVTEENQREVALQIPSVFPTTLYNYLAEGVGNVSGKGAYRALTRGYIHWSSGRMDRLHINNHNPDFCFVRCWMKPSMKQTVPYKVSLLQKKNATGVTSIARAMCECAAG